MAMTQAQYAAIDAHIRQGRHAEARAALQRVLAKGPDTTADLMMAFVLTERREHQQALFYAERAAAAAPTDPNARMSAARALVGLRRLDEAAAAYRAAANLVPNDPAPVVGLAVILHERARFAEAERLCRAAIARNPDDFGLSLNLAISLHNLGLAREAVAILRRALARHPGNPMVAAALALFTSYAGGLSQQEVLEAHTAFAATLPAPPSPPPPFPNSREPRRRLRLGFVSADLRRHAVTIFLEPLLREIDPAAIDPVMFSNTVAEDDVTARLRALVPAWKSVVGMSDADVASLVRRERVDALVDLSGLTPGHRLGAFKLRCAPLQCTWLGYVNTTGLREIDYRIVDSSAGPPGAEAFASESLLRLDPLYLCYQPFAEAPPVAPLPALAPDSAGITFGSFNNLSKLDDDCIALWSRLLHAVPCSRLILTHLAFADPEVAAYVEPRFAAHGIAADRLILLKPPPTLRQVYEQYSRVDIALDTLPFGGATTTCDALYHGVPVLALEGDRFASRQAASIIRAAGLPDLIARDAEHFLEIGRRLAADLPALAALRAGLRARLLASPVCDAPGFARRFEACIREAWARWCAGNSGPAPRP